MSILVILGAGGHGKVCADVAAKTGAFERIVFSDKAFRHGTVVASWPIAFHDEDLTDIDRVIHRFVIGVGQTTTGHLRRTLFEWMIKQKIKSTSVVSAEASVGTDVEIGSGTFVGSLAIINIGARVGVNCIVNSRALVEHDATVGDHVHVSTGAILNGGVAIGDCCLVGSGAIVLPGIQVCADAVIGAGSVVTHHIVEPGTYLGVPARRVRD